MDWKNECRTRLPEFLEKNGDLAPPWEQFPAYERYTIGWRMGMGEDWMGLWHIFLEDFLPTFEARLSYLQRHPPAPVTWTDFIYPILYPLPGKEKISDEHRAVLRKEGLIATDIAYSTWLSQQQGIHWPWESAATPEDAARYWTRGLWFWSRQVAGLRNGPAWEPSALPEKWQSCAEPLKSGEMPNPNTGKGLLTLAQMLSAGRVTPPWQLGLSLNDFADSFEEDMGYVDAFRLWGMSSFDDHEQLQQYLTSTQPPEEWERWTSEQFYLG